MEPPPTNSTSPAVPLISPDDLKAIHALYVRGLALEAFRAAEQFGPLENWPTVSAMVLAGRIAANVGAPVLAYRLHLRAYRLDRQSPLARYYYALNVTESRGPLFVWNFLKSSSGRDGALRRPSEEPTAERTAQRAVPTSPEQAEEQSLQSLSDMHALRARVAGMLRDFGTAERCLSEAETLVPGRAWHAVERSHLLQFEDRCEEALAAARRSLELHPHPWYRPGVQSMAHLLELLDRDKEAMELLLEASAHLESAPLLLQLAALQTELKLYNEAAQSYERSITLAPLLEDPMRKWLTAQRCRVTYFRGDFEQAAEFAHGLEDDFHKGFAERLAALNGRDDGGKGAHRVELPVSFVRQHYKTCAPATIAAIGRFWKMPGDHLALAEAICYDGTPAHKQRAWLESHGWRVREFDLTWESAVALIDLGLPFTVASVHTASAHLQSVIGYDDIRKTFVLRDPHERHVTEAIAKAFLEHHRSTGPRAMVFVPEGRGELLNAVPLPESALYDQLHRLEHSLESHNRAEAAAALEQMRQQAPGHRLTLEGRRHLAEYDANDSEMRQCIDGLLQLFPRDANLRLARLGCLRQARREDRLNFLKQICSDKQRDPIFWQQFAYELSLDARNFRRAERLLWRSLRYRPIEANTFSIYAEMLCGQRRFAEAVELFRFATCLEDKREQHARAYFTCSRHLKQTPAAVALLEDRFRRHGHLSAQPACTLFGALCAIHEDVRAFAALDQAVELRPNDGELLLFAADSRARAGQFEQAEKLLARAKPVSAATAWLRASAFIAGYRGDLKVALGLWRQVLENEPLALDANRALAQLLAEVEGRSATLGFLKQICERFPHHFQLQQLHLDWLQAEGSAIAEPVVRRLVEINPSNAWARRELASLLSDLRRFDEALTEVEHARQLDPNHPYAYTTRGHIQALAGKIDEARADFRRAIELSVDTTFAISHLIELCRSHAERKAALKFVEEQLIRQVVFGDGLLAFRNLAHSVLEPDELLASLRQGLKERPDLWHAHSAVIQQLTEMGRYDEAALCLRDATARFPLLPRIWVDAASLHQARHDSKSETEALEKALQLSPAWSEAARELASAYQRQGQLERARQVLENACALQPLDSTNFGLLALALWNGGQKQLAAEKARHAILLNPGFDLPWRLLRDWAEELEQPELVLELARDLTQRRPGEGRSWIRLSQALPKPEQLEERLRALEKAIELNPRSETAWDLRARSLAEADRWDEALAACTPSPWQGHPSLQLRLRAAWIERQRGRLDEAIGQMHALLKDNPDYYLGWRELAEWFCTAGNFNAALQPAVQLARLAPLDETSFGYLGDVKRHTGDRAGAQADFRRALELNSNYTFAGFSLFDMQLEENDLVGAGQTLETLRRHDTEWVQLRVAQLAIREGDPGKALPVLEKLLARQHCDVRVIQNLAQRLIEARAAKEVERIASAAITTGRCHSAAGRVLIDARKARDRWWYLRELTRLQKLGPAGQEAVVVWFEESAAKIAARRRLFDSPIFGKLMFRLALRQHASWLRKEDSSWGRIGYALMCLRKRKEVCRWLADWRERKAPELWMFTNLVVALHEIGNEAEAREAVHHALSLPSRDSTRPRFQLWAAIDSALAGDVAGTQRLLMGVPPREHLGAHDAVLRDFVGVLADFFPSPPPKRFDKTHRQRLSAFLTAHRKNRDKTMLRIFHRTLEFISAKTESHWPVLWGYMQRWGPLMLVIVSVIVIILARALS